MPLSPPTQKEIKSARDFAERCYPVLPALRGQGKIFLVPHAGVEESRICTAAALAYSPPDAQALILGVDHSGGKSLSDHSLTIPGAFLSSYVPAFLPAATDPARVARKIASWLERSDVFSDSIEVGKNTLSLEESDVFPDSLERSENRIAVFSVDLSHYQQNQDQVIRQEEELISALLEGDPERVGRSLGKGGPNVDGPDELRVLGHLVQLYGWGGKGLVACYTDSRGRRDGWTTQPGEKAVSYAGLVWCQAKHQSSPHSTVAPHDRSPHSAVAPHGRSPHSAVAPHSAVTPYEESLLAAFARSALWAAVWREHAASGEKEKGDLPPLPHMPKWSIWTQVDFGAFVGCQTPEGRVVGSIGRFQNKDQTTAENVLAASVDILSDARGRWGYEIKPELVDELKVYVNLLQPEEDWVEMEAKDLPGKISSADKWGIFLRLAGGRAATFLPSVWAERPALSAEQLLEMLSEKAGGKKEDWRQAKARLYKTKLIELC